MKKLKDFIYDKNDIIIAALILAAAALIIAWRMDVILQYPKELINADDPAVEEPIDGGTQPDDTNTGDKPADNTGADNNDNSGTTGGDNTNPAQPAQLWVDGKLSKNVEVDVTGTTASAAAQPPLFYSQSNFAHFRNAGFFFENSYLCRTLPFEVFDIYENLISQICKCI